MSRTPRHRRKPNDRGAVTVEAAATLATFVVVLSLAIGGLMAVADQIRCVDAAREAARLTARGDPEQARQVATQTAPPNATVTITTKGEHIEVTIHATPVGGLLPGLEVQAEAVAVAEPADAE